MMAALLTRMSRVATPVRSFSPLSSASNSVSTSPGTPNSLRTANARPPAASMSATVLSAASSPVA